MVKKIIRNTSTDQKVDPFNPKKNDWSKKAEKRIINSVQADTTPKVVKKPQTKKPAPKPKPKTTPKKPAMKKTQLQDKVKGYRLYPNLIHKFTLMKDKLKIDREMEGEFDHGISEGSLMMHIINIEEKVQLRDLFRGISEFDGTVDITNKEIADFLEKRAKEIRKL